MAPAAVQDSVEYIACIDDFWKHPDDPFVDKCRHGACIIRIDVRPYPGSHDSSPSAGTRSCGYDRYF